MRNRGFRLDAVTEIEDQPPRREIFQYVVDRTIQRVAAGDQGQRIEIALYGDLGVHTVAGMRGLSWEDSGRALVRRVPTPSGAI